MDVGCMHKTFRGAKTGGNTGKIQRNKANSNKAK